MVVAIKLIGIFLGVLARSLSPYLRKLREGKIKSFQRRRLASSIGSLVLGIVITLLIFPQFQAPAPNGGLEVYVKLFCAAFGFGFGMNQLADSSWHAMMNRLVASSVSEAASWAGAFRGRGARGQGGKKSPLASS